MKRCKWCQQLKPLTEFYRVRPTTLSSRCRQCHGLRQVACASCGQPFIGATGKYCGPACKKIGRPRTLIDCSQCGVSFYAGRLAAKCCSLACGNASKRGFVPWNKGLDLPAKSPERACLVCATVFRATADFKHRKQIYCSHRCYLVNRRVSKPEAMVGTWMATNDIAAVPQYRLGRWTFDFFIPAAKVVVEVDGSYWHSSEVVQERDARKDRDCAARGLTMIRVSADLASKDVDGACAALLPYVAQQRMAEAEAVA